MADGTISAVEVRPLPSLEEFARFLFERDEAFTGEARGAQRRLLQHYAAVWANYEGIPNRVAQQKAEELFEAAFLSAGERQAEADFSKDFGE